MDSSDEQFDKDATRMKKRGFAGYIKDRMTGKADFAPEVGQIGTANAEARKAAGMKKGGVTKRYAKGGGIEQRGKTRGRCV
jgi:hypothetical protein